MMRRLLGLLGLLTLLSNCTTPEAAGAEAPFTAMTFNIRYGTAQDGADAWPLRRDMLGKRIAEASPAILGVQEALAAQLEFLEQCLPDHVRIGQGRDGGERGEHAALFLDRRRFRVLESGDFWLSETPQVVASVGWDAALTRICTWARVQDTRSRRTLTIWNAHFDHRGANARLRSAELIAQKIAATSGPNLLLGDFNTGERSAPLTALRAAGLRDTFRDVSPDAATVGTFHAFKGGTSGEKIDYILTNEGLVTRSAAILSQPGANGRWPSDHHPVVASLSFSTR